MSEDTKVSEWKSFLSGKFFSESIAELKKISFPTRKETTQATMVTLIILGFVSLFLFLVDVVWSRVVTALLPG